MFKLKTPILPTVLVAVVAFGTTLMLTSLSLFSFIELKGLDLLFTLRGSLPPPEDIVIVAIDEPSMAEIGKGWPWPRSLHAQLIRKLNQAGARVIAFDMLFAELSTPAEDQAFAQALFEAKNVVLVKAESVIDDPLFRHTLPVNPAPMFRNAAIMGHPIAKVDADGVTRRTQLLTAEGPTFALQIFRRFIGNPPGSLGVPEQKYFSPSTLLQNRLINYWGPAHAIKTVSYYQALNYAQELPPGLFSDKIILVGWSLEGTTEPQRVTGDFFLTPFSWVAEGASSGVEVQATIVSNLLAGQFIDELNLNQRRILLLALAFIVSALFAKIHPLAAPFIVILLSGLLLALVSWLFIAYSFWLPTFSMILLLTLTYISYLLMGVLNAERERRQFLEAMNRQLETKVIERTQELAHAHQELNQRHVQLETAYHDLAVTQEQLVHSEKMASLGMLVAGIAHELNNPISYVYSNLEFIQDYIERLAGHLSAQPPAPPENNTPNPRKAVPIENTLETLRELVASCQEGSKRVKKIVLDLRTFSRIDDLGLAPVDLHEALESTLNLLSPQYQDRITLHRHYAELPLVECYPSQINQVLMNLLQNAVQAIPDDGEVWIYTQLCGEWIRIIIRDNGIGIAEEHLSRIFDPFFTTKEIGMGTGLGLSITYRIIEQHGGKISVKSQVNQGTEFTIELPIYSPRKITNG